MLSGYPFRRANLSLLNSALGPSLAKKNEAFHHFLSPRPGAEVGAQASDTERSFSLICGRRNTCFGSRHVLANSLWLIMMIGLLLTVLPSPTFAKDPAAEKGKETQVERKPNELPLRYSLEYSRITRVVDRAEQNVCYVAMTSDGGVKMSCVKTAAAAKLDNRTMDSLDDRKFFKFEDRDANIYCYISVGKGSNMEMICTKNL